MNDNINNKQTNTINFFWLTNALSIPVGLFTFPFIPMWVFLLIPIIIILMEFTARYSIKQRKTGKFGKKLLISRIFLIVLAIIYLMPAITIIGFTENKYMYSIKKYFYSQSIFCNKKTINNLPEKLPKNIKDYCFRNEIVTAPDYHKGAYLMFRTDSATIAELEQICKEKGGQFVPFGTTFEELKNTDLKDIANDTELIRESKLSYLINSRNAPYNFQSVLPDRFLDDISDNSSIYSIKEYTDYNRYIYVGCLFDYDSGIVIIWG